MWTKYCYVLRRILLSRLLMEPPADTAGPKKFILFFSDIFGPFFRNAQLIQDYFASQGG